MGEYVAKIIGTHPRWGFNREFLKDVDPRNPKFPEDGLYEVQTRARKYYLVENGNVREISKDEAKELAKKMGSVMVDPIATGIEQVVSKYYNDGIRSWEKNKKRLSRESVEAWERTYDLLREFGGGFDDRVARLIWKSIAELVDVYRYAYECQGDAEDVAGKYLHTLKYKLLRYWIAIVRILPREKQDKKMEEFAGFVERLYQIVQKYREEQGKRDKNTENVEKEESKDAGLKGCD